MNNQSWNEAWSNEQIAEFKEFWTSKVGEEYLEKLEGTKQLFFNAIMNATDKEILSNLSGRAAAIELVIQDIQTGIATAINNEKEEKTVKKE